MPQQSKVCFWQQYLETIAGYHETKGNPIILNHATVRFHYSTGDSDRINQRAKIWRKEFTGKERKGLNLFPPPKKNVFFSGAMFYYW